MGVQGPTGHRAATKGESFPGQYVNGEFTRGGMHWYCVCDCGEWRHDAYSTHGGLAAMNDNEAQHECTVARAVHFEDVRKRRKLERAQVLADQAADLRRMQRAYDLVARLDQGLRVTSDGQEVQLIDVGQQEKESSMSRADVIAIRMRELEAEAAKLAALPKEPTTEDPDGAMVVWFVKVFGEQEYTYAAVRSDAGVWYVTGQRAPQGLVWDDLVEWIGKGQKDPVDVWVADGWGQVGTVSP